MLRGQMVDAGRMRLVGWGLAALAVLAVGTRWAVGSPPERAPAQRPAAKPEIRAAPARSAFVHVVGAVRRPGVYRVREGGRVLRAVRAAGGLAGEADAGGVNLAAKVTDGAQIVIPARGAAGAGVAASGPGAPGGPAAGPVNLNTASPEQLDGLDGIGPTTAAKIVEYRKQHGGFGSLRDLDRIPGIGPKRLAALKGKVTV